MVARVAHSKRTHEDDKFQSDAYMRSVKSVRKYWREIARYPLYPQALAIVLLLGVLAWSATYSGWVGLFGAVLGVGYLGQYLIGVVQETTLGHAHPPGIVDEIVTQPGYLRLTLLLLYIGIFVAATKLSGWLGIPLLAYLSLGIGVAMLPAFIAVLAVVDDMREAGNPLRLRHFIFNTERGYYALGIPMIVLAWIGYAMHDGLASLLCFAAATYLLVALSHLLGFVACHRYAVLNTDAAVLKQGEDTRRRNAQQDALDKLLGEIDALIARGDPRTACDIMFQEHAGLTNPLQFHTDLYHALQARRQYVHMLVQGKRLIHMLMQVKHTGRALSVYEECLDISPFFRPWDMRGVLQLAEASLQERRPRCFDKIVTSVVLRNPGGPETAALQFRKARYLAEIEKNDAAALEELRPLVTLVSHPLHSRIAALYRALQNKAA